MPALFARMIVTGILIVCVAIPWWNFIGLM